MSQMLVIKTSTTILKNQKETKPILTQKSLRYLTNMILLFLVLTINRTILLHDRISFYSIFIENH